MSTAWILRILLSFQLPADAPNASQLATPPTSQQATQEEIDRAIQALDSDSFRARENATEQLWRFAEQAKPPLQQVAEQGSLEARSRVASILADIEMSITPETSPEQRRLVRQFQVSSPPRRAGLLWEILKTGDIDRVTNLVLARDAWKRQDWEQVAVHYDRLYQSSTARIDGPYFSGLAIARSGKTAEGEAIMATAIKEAYHPRTIIQLYIYKWGPNRWKSVRQKSARISSRPSSGFHCLTTHSKWMRSDI